MIDFVGRIATAATHKIYSLPVLVLMPHSRCNCRCVMCDIWKANQEKSEISIEELERHLEGFKKLGVRRVALSGGEALMHSNLWKFCDLLHSIGMKISLLSTGITLSSHAREVVSHCDDVIVSLDGSREVHNAIRNIPNAYEKLFEGVHAVKTLNPSFRVTGRTVLQKQNFMDFPNLIPAAKEMKLDQVSFLGADVSSEAFNRPDGWTKQKISEVSLSDEETNEMERLIQASFVDFAPEYENGFIAEHPAKMMEIVQHYRGINGTSDFPRKKCNAPWVSAVIESNGDVRPCFFHPAYGNIHKKSFKMVINSEEAVAFRKGLDVMSNPVCRQCVCSLHLGLTQFA
jgi:MoaA/NifB/PqqE/SkfB family radical SAM enzyme